MLFILHFNIALKIMSKLLLYIRAVLLSYIAIYKFSDCIMSSRACKRAEIALRFMENKIFSRAIKVEKFYAHDSMLRRRRIEPVVKKAVKSQNVPDHACETA